MQLMKLGSLILVGALAAGSVGCVVRAHGRVAVPVAYVEVQEEPPPPRVWVTEVRPGYVFVQGRWVWHNGRWDWRDGYWERQRANHVWVDGRWERRGNRHVWVEGSWRAGGRANGHVHNPGRGPAVRDHRRNDPPPPPPSGPKVRDHRR